MRALWQGIVRIVFWSYERGSWPYDVMVIVIVLFVLATPSHWFHDQPQVSAFASSQVQFRTQDFAGHTRTYRLDAAVLPPEKRASSASPELERETHDILARTVDDLRDQSFQVVRIEPVRGDDGSIVSYDVTVQP
ncbi:MAG: hypothetical protein WAK78_14430 [Candidatus Acidiferrales bacterium]|jgi:hypothetical protein